MTKRELREAVTALEAAYSETRELTPADTVNRFKEAVGEELAKATVATLIKRSSWDGRISRASKEWADTIPTTDADVYTTIHMAHLDQIAREMKKGENA